MSNPNRAALINKIYKALRKPYKPVMLKDEQPLLEALMLGSCLENAPYEAAAEVLQKVKTSFFDLNEVRVSSVKELSEAMSALPDAPAAAVRLKGILQSVFESEYNFDLERLKKLNLGLAIKDLHKLAGASPFVVAYATQTALGGHAIPLDSGTISVLVVLGVINEQEAKQHAVPGLERIIPKNKGQEFSSLLHQLGAEFFANPFGNSVRDLILSISPDAKDRLPKRGAKKPVEPPPAPVAAKPAQDKKAEAKKPEEKHAEVKKLDGKKPDDKKKHPEKPAEKAPAAAASKKKPEPARPEHKKPEASKPKADHGKKADKHPPKKKPATKQLSRQKPR